MSTVYRLDPARSRCTVQAYASGLLAFLGHDPLFVIRQFTGSVEVETKPTIEMSVELTIRATSLALQNSVKASDRAEIERRTNTEVLETGKWPEISFRSNEANPEIIAPGRLRVQFAGLVLLHGISRPHQIGVDIQVFDDGIRVGGTTQLRMTDYQIRPVTAFGGALQLKDTVSLTFDLGAFPEGK